jgi:hypothetical protein
MTPGTGIKCPKGTTVGPKATNNPRQRRFSSS